MQMGKTGDQAADLQVEGQPLYPSATTAQPSNAVCILLRFIPVKRMCFLFTVTKLILMVATLCYDLALNK